MKDIRSPSWAWPNLPTALLASVAAVALVGALWLFEGRAGLSLWDEGYLWYGSQRVLQREVPLRDFLAYDPARYYWAAAFMAIFRDDGALVVRIAGYAFQTAGLAFLLSTIASERRRGWVLEAVCIGLVLALWMFPRHKLYDVAIAIALVAGAARWLRSPSHKATVLLGVMVGVSAIVGRNHGVYGFLGCLIVLSMAHVGGQGDLKRRLLLFFVGVLLGYLPMLVLLVATPGLWDPFIRSIEIMFERGATNLPLPVPWPWTWTSPQNASMFEALRYFLIGVSFLALLGIPAVLLFVWARARVLLSRSASLSMAGAAMALPYAHFAFARAELSHLAQAAAPALIAILAFPYATRAARIWCYSLIVSCSTLIMLPAHPGWQAWKSRWEYYQIAGDRLRLPAYSADELTAITEIAESQLDEGETVLAVPYWPGTYALLRQKSPMWEIYPLVPRTSSEQAEELERLEASDVGLVFLHGGRLDGRPDGTFSATHPLIYRELRSQFTKVSSDSRLPEVEILQ